MKIQFLCKVQENLKIEPKTKDFLKSNKASISFFDGEEFWRLFVHPPTVNDREVESSYGGKNEIR